MDLNELSNTLKKTGGELGKRLVLFMPEGAPEDDINAVGKLGLAYIQKSMPQQQLKDILEKLSGG